MKLPLSRVAEFLSATGEFDHKAVAQGYSIDSRTIQAGELFFAREANAISFEAVEDSFAAYQEALERVLGVPTGSLTIIDRPTLQLWFG